MSEEAILAWVSRSEPWRRLSYIYWDKRDPGDKQAPLPADLIGWRSNMGGCSSASSIAVMPTAQISQSWLYPPFFSTAATSGAILWKQRHRSMRPVAASEVGGTKPTPQVESRNPPKSVRQGKAWRPPPLTRHSGAEERTEVTCFARGHGLDRSARNRTSLVIPGEML